MYFTVGRIVNGFRRRVLVAAMALSLLSLPALAQATSYYFNFDLTNSGGGTIYLRGSMITDTPLITGTSATGNFTGASINSMSFYPSGLSGGSGTSYGVTSVTASSGSSFGTYKATTGGSYYVKSFSMDFQSYDTSGNTAYYVLKGTAASSNSASFTLYKTGADYVTTSAFASQLKAVVSGTNSTEGSFSTQALNQAPEIDGGSAPKAALLFTCLTLLAARARVWRFKLSPSQLSVTPSGTS